MAYNALQKSFQKLTIVADETGSNEFMQSFSEYIKDHNPALSLFDEFNFRFNKSELGVLVQLADIMSGCLAFCYDENKKSIFNAGDAAICSGSHGTDANAAYPRR